MRNHLGCTGSVNLGLIGEGTQKRLETVAASWLEYLPESQSLLVRHIQPDDVAPLREIAGELMDFLHAVTDAERSQISGGALFYQDEVTGQYVRLKVCPGGSLSVAWAHVDYAHAPWEPFNNQPVTLVFEPYVRLNGAVTFESHPNAAHNLRRIIDGISGQYAQGDYAISSTIGRISLSLRDVNADALTVVNALRYMAMAGTLTGQIDVSSFRAGDLEDYCRFSFHRGDTRMARPLLWPETSDGPTAPAVAMCEAA